MAILGDGNGLCDDNVVNEANFGLLRCKGQASGILRCNCNGKRWLHVLQFDRQLGPPVKAHGIHLLGLVRRDIPDLRMIRRLQHELMADVHAPLVRLIHYWIAGLHVHVACR